MPTRELSTPAPPSAIIETCLSVADLDRARDFYAGLLGYAVMTGDERFCALRVGDRQVLLLFLRGSDPEGSRLPFGFIPAHGTTGQSHVGFSVSKDDLPEWRERLRAVRVAIESEFTWPLGGTSIYFRDPDGHLLELLTPGVWGNGI